jgi:Uma2 family endonuclease
MATTRRTTAKRAVDYPTSDGRPMAETEFHGQDMIDLIETLRDRYAAEPDVYVWGNMLLFYEEGNRRKHVSPDVFLVRGVPKLPQRKYYLLWAEGKAPDLVIELTSKTTRREDQTKKLILYRDVLKVPEYFQFDPTEDYLKPSLQGHRLAQGQYVPIAPVAGRLPSAVLGLHLERDGLELRLYDPATGRRLLKPQERTAQVEAAWRAEEAARSAEEAARRAEEAARRVEEAARREAEAARARAEVRAEQTEAENERLRRELDALRREQSGGA